MICEIVCVGTEILLGDIVNTNAVFLAKELAKMGISVLHQSVVGDNNDRLAECLRQALSRSDIVITTGGLGPTADDITREKCCEVMSSELEFDESIFEKIRQYFENKNIEMPPTNKRQAYIPKDGIVFHNHNGTAPGFAIEKDGKCIIALPGPPREMKPMFENSAVKVLKKYSTACIVSHNVRMFGIGEAAMAEKASELLDGENPTAAPYAKDGECLLRITAYGKTFDEAEKICSPAVEKAKELFKDYVYGIDMNCIEEALVALLKKHKLKISFAESCTGGLASKRITDIPGSSEVTEGGVVSYSNRIKNKILGVSQDNLERYGAVSEAVAREMAVGIKKLTDADFGVGITGIAGPDSDGTQKPVGLSFIAVSDGENVQCMKLQTSRKDRDYNRYVNASNAFNMVRKIIIEKYGN